MDALIADLGSERAIVRDAAVARLAIIGTRAVERLVTLAADRGAAAATRGAALRALDGMHDARALDAGLRLRDDPDPEVAAAAVAVAKSAIAGEGGVAAVDRLASVAVDTTRPERVRAAALQALSDLEFTTVEPLLDALSSDRQAGIRDLAARLRNGERREPENAAAAMAAAVRGDVPDDPEALRTLVAAAGRTASLTDLRQLIDVVRERESSADAERRRDWVGVRAAVHAALARRGSRLAVFDLRETVAGAGAALPVEFVAALVTVGDASCLDAIAAAADRAIRDDSRDDWWLRHLVDAFQAIAARERLTRRHAAMKRIAARWPAAVERLRARPPPQ